MARRAPALVLSLCLPGDGKKEESVLLGFRPPRDTLLVPLLSREPAAVAGVVAGIAAADAVVLVDSAPDRSRRRDPAPLREALRRACPGAEVLLYDPDGLLRFLWDYRDRQDPLALGHARERNLFPPGLTSPGFPRHRTRKKKRARRLAVEALRGMLAGMATSLGVRCPLPPLTPAPGGWGLRRMADVIDACAGLFAGMLHRFGAPIAIRSRTADGPVLLLADRGRREREGLERTHGVPRGRAKGS